MARNPQQQAAQPERMTENEAITARQKLEGVLAELALRRADLEPVLPRDMPFEAFATSVNQALRNNPRLLKCTGHSLVNACIKAAYDGLKIDGKEAAIVDAEESYKEGNVWKKRTVARYMPMVFGLIKKILQTGLVLDMSAIIVYANDAFDYQEGIPPVLHHKPLVTGPRGAMIGCYSRALLKSGHWVAEWMRADDILDIQKESKTDNVWNRWPTEMWKKTVVRRHRKSLPSTNDVVFHDMELREMFPQFDRDTPHPQLAGIGHNSGIPPRPTRHSAIEHSGDNGVAMDFGEARETVTVDQRERERDVDRGQQKQSRKAEAAQGQEGLELTIIPGTPDEWDIWERFIHTKAAEAKDADALQDLWKTNDPILKAASKATRDRVSSLLTDRIADVATDSQSGAVAGEGDSSDADDGETT